MVSFASKTPDEDDRRQWRPATVDDLMRDGIYARFIAGCFRDRVRLCKWLSLLVEIGNAIKDGAKSKRSITDKLSERLGSLPPDMNVSTPSIDRACEQIADLLGIQILVVTRFGNTPCTFTPEGRVLWEEAVRWNELGLLESHDLVDFPPVLRLARYRIIGEGGGGDDADIQRPTG